MAGTYKGIIGRCLARQSVATGMPKDPSRDHDLDLRQVGAMVLLWPN